MSAPLRIFVSYASEDRAVADLICHGLESRGLPCWIAPRDIRPGEEYAVAIVSAIRHCSHMAVVFSGHANRSRFVCQEVERAVSLGKPVLPFRIENVLPSQELELFLSSRHWLDARQEPYEPHVEALAEAITASAQHGSPREASSEEHCEVPQLKSRPSRNGSPNRRLLLRSLVTGLICIIALGLLSFVLQGHAGEHRSSETRRAQEPRVSPMAETVFPPTAAISMIQFRNDSDAEGTEGRNGPFRAGSDGPWTAWFANGGYHWLNDREDGAIRYINLNGTNTFADRFAQEALNPAHPVEVTVQVQGSKAQTKSPAGAGILWAYVQGKEYYIYILSPSGNLELHRFLPASGRLDFFFSQPVNDFDSGRAYALGISRERQNTSFWLDGKAVNSLILNPRPEGHPGIAAVGKGLFTFRSVRIYAAQPANHFRTAGS